MLWPCACFKAAATTHSRAGMVCLQTLWRMQPRRNKKHEAIGGLWDVLQALWRDASPAWAVKRNPSLVCGVKCVKWGHTRAVRIARERCIGTQSNKKTRKAKPKTALSGGEKDRKGRKRGAHRRRRIALHTPEHVPSSTKGGMRRRG